MYTCRNIQISQKRRVRFMSCYEKTTGRKIHPGNSKNKTSYHVHTYLSTLLCWSIHKNKSSMHAICFFCFLKSMWKLNITGLFWTQVVKNEHLSHYEPWKTNLNTLGQVPRPALLHINIRFTSVDDDLAASKPRRFSNTMMSNWTQSVWQQSN